MTFHWCESLLKSQAFEHPPLDPLDCTNQLAYCQLRQAIRQHIDSLLLSELLECVRPTGGYDWEPETAPGEATEMDLFGEGEDPLATQADSYIYSKPQNCSWHYEICFCPMPDTVRRK